MIIAAFDLATATGVCDGVAGAAPRLWSWYLDDGGKRDGQRFKFLHDHLGRYFAKEPCDAVVYEEPMPVGVFAAAGAKKDRRVMMSDANVNFSRGLIGVLKLACEQASKPYEGLAVQDARQAVLGWRMNVEKRSGVGTKDRVMDEVRRINRVDVDNNNEADAWVLWFYACMRANPRLAVAASATPLFAGLGNGRG